MELYNEVQSSVYRLEKLHEISSINGVKSSSTINNRDLMSLQQDSYENQTQSDKPPVNYGNIRRFTIRFKNINHKTCYNHTKNKYSGYRFNKTQQVIGRKIVCEWNLKRENNDIVLFGGKTVTLYPMYISHFIFENVLCGGNHYRFDMFAKFRKVRRSLRIYKKKKIIHLPLMYA